MTKFELKKYIPILVAVVVSIIGYLIHKLIFYYNRKNHDFQGFSYSIETIYAFFMSCSLIILFILIQVKTKNIDSVGNTFITITCIKMGLSFVFLNGISIRIEENVRLEKINFIFIFSLFLAIETIITIRLLNKKQ